MQPTETSSETTNPNFVRPASLQADALRVPKSDVKRLDELPIREDVEPPVELFQEKHGRPYLADVLDIKELYGKTGQEEDITKIDEFVLAEITEQKYKSDKKTYESIISDLKKKASISDRHDYTEQIRKLSIWVQAEQARKQIERMSRELNGPTNK
jgi:glutamyl-tRNA reductase